MDEADFLTQADAMLQRVETLIEQAIEASDLEIDLEPQDGGILKLEFADASQIIVNRHVAAREIWVAARAGGFHYRAQAGQWLGTRDGRELIGQLEELITQQAGRPVLLQD